MKKTIPFIVICLILGVYGCINPFAPALNPEGGNNTQLGDPKTIEGFFQNFLYAYNTKDTVVYSALLSPDFTFSYRNYDKGMDMTFNREEDMQTTYRLFNAAQNLDFVWNDILANDGTETERTISRSFDLTITFSPSDVVRVYGRVFFILKRKTENDNWMLSYWRDDSTY